MPEYDPDMPCNVYPAMFALNACLPRMSERPPIKSSNETVVGIAEQPWKGHISRLNEDCS